MLALSTPRVQQEGFIIIGESSCGQASVENGVLRTAGSLALHQKIRKI
jgi:hypothetical protein